MPTLTIPTPGEAVVGSCGACCFGGRIFSTVAFATGEVNVFRGTGSSKMDGLLGGVATLPLAAAVDVFASASAFLEAAVDFVLLINLRGVVAVVTAGPVVLDLVY